MAVHDIVVVGAAAGGVEALLKLAAMFPRDLPAAVFVVVHVPANGTSVLPGLLGRAGPLPASHARDGQAIRHGHIYVAPPDHHLLVFRGALRLSRGARENRSRPAVDPLFRSAAVAYGDRVIGIVLSGTLDDGTAGLAAIKDQGGVAIVQDPEEAAFPGMPASALANVAVDACLPLAKLGPAVVRLVGTVAEGGGDPEMADELSQEVEVAAFDLDDLQDPARPGIPSVFSCPECNGVLYEIHEGEITRYRCRVGHAYATESLHIGQQETIEEALWTALRALEEKAELLRRLLRRAQQSSLEHAAERYADEVAATLRQAAAVRQLLLRESPEEEMATEVAR